MKLLALRCARRALSWTTVACLSAGVFCPACESSGASAASRPAPSVKAHPAFPAPKTPEMLPEPEPVAARAAQPLKQPTKSRDKKDWQANCKIQSPCSQETKELPTCDAHTSQRPWIDVVTEGDAVNGKDVDVSGTLGLSLIKQTGSGVCAPGACCHTLDMQIVLVGEPNGSLPLRGLTCSGDDSMLCCNVPAEGQAVVAHGRLRKVTAGVSKWQLEEPKLCLIDNSPRH